MIFYRKAEFILEKAAVSTRPSILRQLVKVRLMIARLYGRKNAHSKALEILWGCVNLLTIECQVRMHEYLDCEPSDSDKMVKWAKYMVPTLFQIISCYITINKFEVVIETSRMLTWICETFFDHESNYFLSIMDYIRLITKKYGTALKKKNEIIQIFKHVHKKNFKNDQIYNIGASQAPLKKGTGFIPEASEEEKNFLENGQDKFWKKASNWGSSPFFFLQEKDDIAVTRRSSKILEMNIARIQSSVKKDNIMIDNCEEETRPQESMRKSLGSGHRKNNYSYSSTKNSSIFTIKKHKKSKSVNFFKPVIPENYNNLDSILSSYNRRKDKTRSSQNADTTYTTKSFRPTQNHSKSNISNHCKSKKRAKNFSSRAALERVRKRNKIDYFVKEKANPMSLARIANSCASQQECNQMQF